MINQTFWRAAALVATLMLAGCTAVNGDNSFQSAAPNGVDTQQTSVEQPADGAAQDATDTAPTNDPNAAGYNG